MQCFSDGFLRSDVKYTLSEWHLTASNFLELLSSNFWFKLFMTEVTADQWTGFYMIETSVMKELKFIYDKDFLSYFCIITIGDWILSVLKTSVKMFLIFLKTPFKKSSIPKWYFCIFHIFCIVTDWFHPCMIFDSHFLLRPFLIIDDPLSPIRNHYSQSGIFNIYLVIIYLFKFNNRNTRKMCEICSKLTIKTPEQCHWHISHLFLQFWLCWLGYFWPEHE